MTSQISINSSTDRAIQAITGEYARDVLRAVAEHYNFSFEDACQRFIGTPEVVRASKSSKPRTVSSRARDVPKYPLPWCGKDGIRDDWCKAIRLNHGLHSQCVNAVNDGCRYCATCQKHADAGSSGKPTYGDVDDRVAVGIFDYRDPKTQKQPACYMGLLAKLNIEPQLAINEAARFGINIPEEQLELRKLVKGRPKKGSNVASDSDDETSKKSRGRPKKDKKVVVSGDSIDLIAQLQNEIQTDTQHETTINPSTHHQPETPQQLPTDDSTDDEAKKAAKKAKKNKKKNETPEEKAARKAAKKAKKAAEKAALQITPDVKTDLTTHDDEEEEVEVEEVIHLGKPALKNTKTGELYDPETHDLIQ